MKALFIVLFLSFMNTSSYSQFYSKAEECDLLLTDLIEFYDYRFNPIYKEHEAKKEELANLEFFLKEAQESKDKNTRRVVVSVVSGAVSVTLGYFAFRNIKSAVPTNVGELMNPTRMPLYWRILLGAGAAGSGFYGVTQVRDFFLTNKQVKDGLVAVEKAKEEFKKVQNTLNDKMCEANELIGKELEANQCASVGFSEHFKCL